MKTQDTPTIDTINGYYVMHFLEIEETSAEKDGLNFITKAYERALEKAKPFKGKKCHCRAYGGGIAFPCKSYLMKCFEEFNK
jgi:hypothetical protein